MSREELHVCQDSSVEGDVANGSQETQIWEKEKETVGLDLVFRLSTHNYSTLQ